MAAGIRADIILRALAQKHEGKRNDDIFITEVKTGSTWFDPDLLRIDAVAIRKSWKHPLIRAYEVKVDRQDFLRDDKWPGYLNYCHEFYFVCPTNLIRIDELPSDIGLLYYDPNKQAFKVMRKAVYRNIEIPGALFYYIVLSRLDPERHPFFNSEREFLEAWVDNKADTSRLGRAVKTRMAEKLTELTRQVEQLSRQLEDNPDAETKLRQLQEVIKETLDIEQDFSWKWYLDRVHDALASKIPTNVSHAVESIGYHLNVLKEFVNKSRAITKEVS